MTSAAALVRLLPASWRGPRNRTSRSPGSREGHTIRFLKTAPEEVLLVSCADKIENLEAIRKDGGASRGGTLARFKRGRDQQEWYYRSVLAALEERLTAEPGLSLVSQLKKAVAEVFG